MSHIVVTPDLLSDWFNWINQLKYAENIKTIVVAGRSGLLMGTPLAYNLQKQLLIMPGRFETRRTGILMRPNHEIVRVFFPVEVGNYIFIDDCVSSGDTLYKVSKCVKGINKKVIIYAQEHVSFGSDYKYYKKIIRRHAPKAKIHFKEEING
ncbi:MAG: phosphoribosyltransferase [Phenylobacterium sp.]